MNINKKRCQTRSSITEKKKKEKIVLLSKIAKQLTNKPMKHTHNKHNDFFPINKTED